MFTALKFCQGSIAKKDYVPGLKHFCIENGRVRGFNGTLALSSPIPFDIDCKPEALALVKAIDNCNEVIQLAVTPAGRLSIKSGVFKAIIKCVTGDTPHVEPEGDRVDFDGESLLKGLKIIAPFIGNDASRPWANGILFKGQSLFATNNIIAIEYWLGAPFPIIVNIPAAAIKEMLRINEPPLWAQVTTNSMTFHYAEDRWLRTQLLVTNDWPDISKLLSKESVQLPIENELFVALDVLKSFINDQNAVYFFDNEVRTHEQQDEGACYVVDNLSHEGRYNRDMLALLKGVLKTVDWSGYPGPCMFQGDRLRGAIIGMRK